MRRFVFATMLLAASCDTSSDVRQEVLGCYYSPLGPSFLLNGKNLKADGLENIPYSITRKRIGYVVEVHDITLVLEDRNKYKFATYPGRLEYWLLQISDSKSSIKIIANDFKEHSFVRAKCGLRIT